MNKAASLGSALKGRTGTIFADGAESVVAGGHCESSALANALRGAGWDIAESDIIGGGGAPSFMFTADGFPFLGARSLRMRETFFAAAGIPFKAMIPERNGDAWVPIFSQLEAGIPVPLRVDMRFLPYRYNGKYGPKYMEFGWHWITLFSVDFDAKAAFVSDTEFGSMQRIALADLEKARNSKTKIWPPRAEYVLLESAADSALIDRDRLAASGLAALIENYEGKDSWTESPAAKPLPIPTGLAGLEAFPELLRDFDRYSNRWTRSPALSFLAGCIERNGTGGAAFRVLFRDFIASCVSESRPDALRGLLPPLDASIKAWRDLAVEFDSGAAALSKKPNDAERRAVYESCAEKAERLSEAERILYEAVLRTSASARNAAGGSHAREP